MNRIPPTIDMSPDGTFRAPPRPQRLPFSTKLAVGGVLVAALGASLAVAFLAIWVVSLILPVVIIAGGVAWAAMKYRRWQLLRSQGHGGQGHGGPLEPGRFGQ